MIQDGYYQSDTNSVIWWEGRPISWPDKHRLIEPIARVPQSTSAATSVKVEAPSPKPAGRRGQPAADRRRKLLIL